MKNNISKIVLIALLFLSYNFVAQDDENAKSNIQTYTPSKLLSKGQWDIKFFNNLYTETEDLFGPNETKRTKPRETFFTSTLEIFTGVSDNERLNVGVLLEYRSNAINGKNATSVFGFSNDASSVNGLTSIAPALKWQPIEGVGNFSIQSAFHIPVIDQETEKGLKDVEGNIINNAVFLDQNGFTFQNRFFFDYTLPSGDWQLFTELNTEYHFGDDSLEDSNGNRVEGSFANDTFVLAPGVFMSYFPSDKSTILAFAQHFQRFGDFEQDFTSLGFGGKYQLTEVLNLEVLYSKFVRGNATGLGQSFNIGLRALF
ncbi:hypothetical protein [uncultured Polaribacter sp.]|uniref:hypothetical protein n=1 Tax=uncultured Polaribacter sp. TaxID=174711 RepID=UPI0026334740|nr:hypothetical protein [uncultured Polaribacter sp.]